MIVGTAGHIDHGKTRLLLALTGQVGDRRREERERGITIDLGYRYAALTPGAALTGFIDVPGHERFIHNMLAGAQGIDLALLVVAADDGIMPQTREHLAIIGLLGIPRLLVALSKIDRVEPEQVARVQRQLRQWLDAGVYPGTLIVPVSSETGQGIDALRHALTEHAEQVHRGAAEGGFRLPIDRAFSVAGSGIVVTGTALAGQVSVGDSLCLGQNGQTVRVRGLHAQNQPAQQAEAGQRVALNLVGERLSLERIRRGDWLMPAWLHGGTRRLDLELELLADERQPLEHFSAVHVHLGTQDVTARVALLEGSQLAPGGRMFAQLLLNAPLAAIHGDRLVLRDHNARRTLGGGRVLDPFAPARQRRGAARLAQLAALAAAQSLEQVLPVLLEQAESGLSPQRLERQFNRPRAQWQLPSGVREVQTRQGPLLFAESHWQAQKSRVLTRLAQFHAEEPEQPGPDRDRLRRYCAGGLERPAFQVLIDELLAEQSLASRGPWLHLPEHQMHLAEQDQALWTQLAPHLGAGDFDPPWVRDLAHTTGIDEAQVRQLLRNLARLGEVHQVVRDLFYPEATIGQLTTILLELAASDPVIRVATLRDRLGIGRKRTVQILEYFDRLGLTRRVGDERRIRPASALVG